MAWLLATLAKTTITELYVNWVPDTKETKENHHLVTSIQPTLIDASNRDGNQLNSINQTLTYARQEHIPIVIHGSTTSHFLNLGWSGYTVSLKMAEFILWDCNSLQWGHWYGSTLPTMSCTAETKHYVMYTMHTIWHCHQPLLPEGTYHGLNYPHARVNSSGISRDLGTQQLFDCTGDISPYWKNKVSTMPAGIVFNMCSAIIVNLILSPPIVARSLQVDYWIQYASLSVSITYCQWLASHLQNVRPSGKTQWQIQPSESFAPTSMISGPNWDHRWNFFTMTLFTTPCWCHSSVLTTTTTL